MPAIADLSTLPGSLISTGRCQRVSGARALNHRVPGAAKLRIVVGPNGAVTAGGPLRAAARVSPAKGRKLAKHLRRVSYFLGGRLLGRRKRAPYAVNITPAALSGPRRQTLVVQVAPEKGPARESRLDLNSQPCPDLFSAVHRPGRARSLLTMRVDSARPLRSVTFNVPRKLVAVPAKLRGSAGLLKLAAAGERPVSFPLSFPKSKKRTKTSRMVLLAGAGRPQVVVSGGKVTLTGLPPNTGIAQVRLARRGMKKTPRSTLRARLSLDSGQKGLSQRLGVKRR